MARYVVLFTKTGGPPDQRVVQFAEALCMAADNACQRHSMELTQVPDSAFGTDNLIAKGAIGTAAAVGSTQYTQAVSVSHGNAFARHFMAERNYKVNRMDLGNVVEQLTADILHVHAQDFQFTRDVDYLYQKSAQQLPDFPIHFMGNSKSARPDFRLAMPGGQEALFDLTTPAEQGHLLNKKVNSTPVQNLAQVNACVEIIWETHDFLSV